LILKVVIIVSTRIIREILIFFLGWNWSWLLGVGLRTRSCCFVL